MRPGKVKLAGLLSLVSSDRTLRGATSGITMRSTARVTNSAPRGWNVKGFGVGIVRWLVGLIFGIVAAAILFGLAARVTSTSGSVTAVGSLALLMAGFGIAFFPSVFAAGTKAPRRVARRGLIGIALEGLIALVLGGYQLVSHSPLVPSGAFGWLGTVNEAADSVARVFTNDILVAVIGLALMAVSLFLVIALRVPSASAQPAAPSGAVAPTARVEGTTARPPAIAQPRPTQSAPAAQATPAAPPASTALPKTDDEDAKLMADLENLRKRLPKMGVDESGPGGKS